MVSTVLLARTGLRPAIGIPATLLAIALGMASSCPVVSSGPSYRGEGCDKWDPHCIADARGYFYRETGLLRATAGVPMPNHPWALEGRDLAMRAKRRGRVVVARGSIGFFGFFAGPQAHIVDKMALSDPLLARLPARRTPDLCIGHFERIIPEGYRPPSRRDLIGSSIETSRCTTGPSCGSREDRC